MQKAHWDADDDSTHMSKTIAYRSDTLATDSLFNNAQEARDLKTLLLKQIFSMTTQKGMMTVTLVVTDGSLAVEVGCKIENDV